MKWRYYYYRHLTIALLIFAQTASARAEDEFLGSIQLRGGYDSNPTFVPGAKGTALGGINAAVVAGRTTESYIAALSAEASYTRYADTVDAPLAPL